MAMDAFDLAERFQTLVFVMSDLDLGMNTWMSQPFAYPDKPLDRGKRARRRDAGADRRVGPLQGRRRRRHSVPHDPGRRRCRRTSPAAPATTRRRSTASGRTTTSTTWTGWRASSRPRGSYVPKPDRAGRRRRRDRHHRVTAPATGRSTRAAISSQRETGIRTALPAAARLSVHRRADDLPRPLRAHLRRRAEPRRADAGADAAGHHRRSPSPSCAACCTTAVCRSTRGR